MMKKPMPMPAKGAPAKGSAKGAMPAAKGGMPVMPQGYKNGGKVGKGKKC
jgi:hypothetical protein